MSASVARARAERLVAHLAASSSAAAAAAASSSVAAVSACEVAAKTEKELAFDRFVAVFPRLSQEIVSELAPRYEMPDDAVAYVKKLLEYTVPGGKMNRGLSVIDTLEVIKGSKLNEQEYLRAAVMGWLVEWLQGFFLVADDLMDNSHTRRGAPCWYKLPEVGLKAVNDSLILEMAMFKLARNFFGKDKFYVDLVHLLQEVTWKTELGQLLDLRSADPNKVDFSTFTLETHTRIVKYKTAFYSFCLPVQMAYLLAGLPAEAYAEADRILIPMGIYFQVQDDYLDCYGDPSVIGKIGTDIQDNKCGWLIVQALKRASAQQRKVLEDNYARDKPECIARVKQVYRELQLEKVFEEYEARCKTELEELIANVKYAPKAVFTVFLKKIFKRQS